MAVFNGNLLILSSDEQLVFDLYPVQFTGYISLWLQDHMKQAVYDTVATLPPIDKASFMITMKEQNAGKVK